MSPDKVLREDRRRAQSAAEEVGRARLRQILTRAQRDLARRLAEAEGLGGAGRDSFTATRARLVLAQVEAVLRGLAPGVRDLLVEVARAQGGAGGGGVAAYLREADRRYRGLAQPLALSQALAVERGRAAGERSVLARILSDPRDGRRPGVLDRYGQAVVDRFERTLQQRVLAQRPWSDVRDDLVRDSPFLRQAPAHWAERILRTEAMNASNAGAYEALQVAAEDADDLVKILSATFDGRTAADSYAVHGQVRRVSEPFDTWQGPVQHPPARPNDREGVVPHRLAWPLPAGLRPKSDADVLAAWRREGRKGAPPARPRLSTVDVKVRPEPQSAPPPPPKPKVEPVAPAPPAAPPGRPRDVEPNALLARGPGGEARFTRPDGRPLRLAGDEAAATDGLLAHGSDAALGAWLRGGSKGEPSDAGRPYEADLAAALGDLSNALAERARDKAVHLSDLDRVTYEAAAPDREVAARLAADPPRGAPVLVRWRGKLYARDGGEHLAAEVALARAADPKAKRVRVRLVDLDKERREARPAREWSAEAGAAARRVAKGDYAAGAVLRGGLRELLRRYGAATRDDEPGRDPGAGVLAFVHNADAIRADATTPGVAGYHDWNGEIVIAPAQLEAAAAAIESVAADGPEAFRRLPMKAQNNRLNKINVLVHEEVHGASPVVGSAYHGAGIGMEEAATEIIARKLARELVGYTKPTGEALSLPTRKADGGYRAEPGDANPYMHAPYDNYIGALLREVGEVTGHSGVHERVEEALLKTRSSAVRVTVTTPRQHVALFVDALGLRGDRADDLVGRLLRELPRS